MARDIGDYFERMTKRARGGRRLEGTDEPDSESAPERPTTAPRSGGGGLGDMLKDVLRKGRTTAATTTEKTKQQAERASERVRDRVERRRGRATPRSRRRKSRSLPPEGVVTIEYSPRIDGDPDPGEVVWAWVPFEEDPEQGKDRPVVVIGRRGGKLVGVPLTTKRDQREAQIVIGTGDWDPKRRQSYARIWRMLDIDPGETRREGAVLDRDRFDEVVAAVDKYYEVRRPKRSGASGDDFDHDY